MAMTETARPRALPAGGVALLAGAVVLAGFNLTGIGDPGALFLAWREPASAPIGAVQVLHGCDVEVQQP